MTLAAGARLGPYEIQTALGAGGMGEVYRARDTRLDRTVAIKVLSAQLAGDPHFRERFDREARAISALDHPHICALYDVGEHEGTAYLVMQYLDGETLAERLGRSTGRPIPLSEALTITIQVADALEKAHRAGIVHRDLKPGNVMLTKAGAKLLDFGLAKAGPAPTGVAQDFSPAVAGRSKDLRHDDTMSPTISSPLTAQGTILGTFQYMAPEQLEGLDADARTDIFAFGAVLYEMLTGRKAFEGRSQASLIGAILEREPPPVASLQPATPASLDHVVRTCLAKNPDDRFQNAHDLFVQLKWIRDIGSQAASTPAPATRVRSRRGVVIAAVTTAFAATAAGVAVWMLKPEPSQPIRRFAIVLPEGDQFSATGRHIVAISPDGTRLVYVANQRLYIRTIDQLDATPIRGTEEGGADFARSPFFSPDGQWIGFWQGGQLKKVSVNGGAPVVLCAALNPWGASWGANGTILFGQGSQGISQVSASGGQASVLVSVDSKTESAHGPQMLPGGKAVLFTLASSITPQSNVAAFWDNAQIVIQSIDSGDRKVIVQGGADARYVSTGHLIYVRQGTLFAVPFDPGRLLTSGNPFPVADGIRQATNLGLGGVNTGGIGASTGAAHFAVSQDGLFAYVPQDAAAVAVRTLSWVDRQGRDTALPAPDRAYVYPRISPDGTRVALDIRDQEQDIWVWDLARETLTRFTFDPATDIAPVWTPDGQRIAFSRAGQGLFWAADGTGIAERLTESTTTPAPTTFSPDGKRLVFYEGTASQTIGIKFLDLEGKRAVDLVVQPMLTAQNADMSPDGRWLAYQSNESGQNEIYVRPFPDVQGGRWQVSRAGGTRPLWARSGRELFYLAPPAQPATGGAASGVAMMAVPIESGSGFRALNPTRLFAGPYFTGLNGRTYDVSPDGQRFLMVKDKAAASAPARRIIVVENFFEELKRRAPAK